MARVTCDRCERPVTAEARALGWPIAVSAEEYGCPECYGDEAYCSAGHVLPADSDTRDCPACVPAEHVNRDDADAEPEFDADGRL